MPSKEIKKIDDRLLVAGVVYRFFLKRQIAVFPWSGPAKKTNPMRPICAAVLCFWPSIEVHESQSNLSSLNWGKWLCHSQFMKFIQLRMKTFFLTVSGELEKCMSKHFMLHYDYIPGSARKLAQDLQLVSNTLLTETSLQHIWWETYWLQEIKGTEDQRATAQYLVHSFSGCHGG